MYAAIVVGDISLVLTKISVLLLFLDIFISTWIRKATYIVMGMVILAGLWMVFSTVLICIPPHASWNLAPPHRKCLPGRIKWFIDATLNLVLELIIFCLPIPVARSMALRSCQKVWFSTIFALGFM